MADSDDETAYSSDPNVPVGFIDTRLQPDYDTTGSKTDSLKRETSLPPNRRHRAEWFARYWAGEIQQRALNPLWHLWSGPLPIENPPDNPTWRPPFQVLRSKSTKNAD